MCSKLEEVNMSDTIAQGKGVKPQVLYVHYGDNWLRGSEIVLLDLLKSAKDNHYAPVLWCNSEVLAKKAYSPWNICSLSG